MANNPYEFSHDVDDDIFTTEESGDQQHSHSHHSSGHKHTIDGTICPTCNRVHNFGSHNLSPSQQEELLRALDRVPGVIAMEYLDHHDHNHDMVSYIAHQQLKLISKARQRDIVTPTIRATFSVLDELTDGKANRLRQIFDTEQELVAAHIGMKTANNVLEMSRSMVREDEKIREDEKRMESVARIEHILEFICDLMSDRITQLVKTYRGQCRNAGMEPKDEVVASGTFSDDDSDYFTDLLIKQIRTAAYKVLAD